MVYAKRLKAGPAALNRRPAFFVADSFRNIATQREAPMILPLQRRAIVEDYRSSRTRTRPDFHQSMPAAPNRLSFLAIVPKMMKVIRKPAENRVDPSEGFSYDAQA